MDKKAIHTYEVTTREGRRFCVDAVDQKDAKRKASEITDNVESIYYKASRVVMV